MKTVIQTVIAVLIVQVLAAVGFVYSGIFNVAATDPHWSLTSGQGSLQTGVPTPLIG
jgi:hypothetical protein